MTKPPATPETKSSTTREKKISAIRTTGLKIDNNIPDKYLDDLYLNRTHDKDHLLDDEEIRNGKIYKKIPKTEEVDSQ